MLVVLALGLWGGATVARADETPPPTTTVPDAPPPDPYTAPVRTTKPKTVAPRRVSPIRSAPRTYTPPAPVRASPAPAPVARAAQAKPKRPPVVARKHRARSKRKPVLRISVAPVSHVLAAARISVPVAKDAQHPYLWLSGISFAVLAVAGTGLLLLTQRTFRTEWE